MKKTIIMLAVALVACSSSPTVTPEARTKAAEVNYTTQLLACVEAYPAGDPRVDVCADGVRAQWRRGPKDGGS